MIRGYSPTTPHLPTVPADQIEASLAIAKGLWQQSRVAEAEAMLRELVQRQPQREDAAMLLAEVLRGQGRLGAASDAVLALCDANAFAPDLSIRSAHFAQQCDRHATAVRICDQALASNATPPAELLVLAGHVARESGDFETARKRYLAAMDAGIDLEHNHVLGALVNTRRYTDVTDPDIACCETHFRNNAFSAQSRASAGFALGKIRNDLGDYEAAAVILRGANRMAHAARPWSHQAWRAFVHARVADRVVSVRSVAPADFVPVFIVGVPRTGTTLTASLLARAGGGRDRGELRALRFIGEQLVDGGHLGNRAALLEATGLYRRLAVQDDAPAKWYLDQDPLNFRWLHVAAAMFPQARVIHLRRDPRDTALSLWSQDFAHPDLAFAYDFADITAYMAGHDALMAHWRRSLPVPIFELDYERLVSDTDATLAALCEFIGAPLRGSNISDETAPVQSASVWQARQPVYSTSVGRWRHYASYVPEFCVFGSGDQPKAGG